MAFTPYSQTVAPAKFVPEIPFDIYQRGVEKTAATNQANYENIQNNLSGIFKNINPISTADAEILQQKEKDVEAQLGKFALNNLSSPQSVMQLKSYLNQVSNDPDVLAITERAYAVRNEQKAKKEAEEKGLPYYSRALEDASKYIQEGVYIRDKRFNNPGFVGVNLSKARNESLKDVPKERYLGKDGFYHERYNQGALEEGLNIFYSDPRVKKQILYEIEDKHKDRNWEDEGVQEISQYATQAQELYNQAVAQGDVNKAQELQQDLDMYNTMIQDPKGYGEQIKNTVYNQELQDRIKLDKAHSNFNSTEKLGEYATKAQELANSRNLKLYDMQLKTGLTQNQGESQSDYIQRLSQESQKREVEVAQAKSDISLERQKELEKIKQEGRMGVLEYKTKNGVIKIKDNGEKKITIGGKELDKGTLKGDIERKDVSQIEKVLNNYNTTFGLTEFGAKKVDPKTVEVFEKDGVQWVRYEEDDFLGDAEYETPLSDIVKYISDPNTIPTVIKNGTPLTGSVDNVDKSNVEEAIKLKGTENPSTFVTGNEYELNGKSYIWDGKNLVEQ